MKESNNQRTPNCEDIELLLSKRLVDELTDEEKQVVDTHLKSCDRCSSYERILLSLQESVQIKSDEKLAPRPGIRQNIVQRMKDLKPQETGVLQKTYHFFIRLFEYRIPVYQSLTGMILIFLLLMGLKHFPFTFGQKPEKIQIITQMDTSIPTQLKVLDNLEILGRQKIGQNVKEDSTLTQFIVTM
jgi:hypothetical protein